MKIDMRAVANFADLAHHGQRRKYTGDPYIYHPMRVAGMVTLHPWAEDRLIAAAWLHDVLEDTPVTEREIREKFGMTVGDTVVALTNRSKIEAPNASRQDRKRMDWARLAVVSPRAKVVKMYDRLDNLREIGGATRDFKRLYADETLNMLLSLSGSDPRLAEMVGEEARKILRDTR